MPAATAEQPPPRRGTRPATARAGFRRKPSSNESIHPAAAVARVIAAIACLAIAVLMMVNGQGLMSVMPYVVMVAYGCAALWGLTTYRGKITVKQFAIEMMILVIGTLGLRAASPAMFSVEDSDGAPAARAIIKPHLPHTPLGRYTEKALDVLRAVDELTEPAAKHDASRRDALLEAMDTTDLVKHYDLLDSEARLRVAGVQSRAIKHLPTMQEALRQFQRTAAPASVFSLKTEAAHGASRELKAALLRAEGLRARILVVPDGVAGDAARPSL